MMGPSQGSARGMQFEKGDICYRFILSQKYVIY